MLQNVWPFGLAMFCGDILEGITYFWKHGHKKHINGAGGISYSGNGWTRCRTVCGPLSTGTSYHDAVPIVHDGRSPLPPGPGFRALVCIIEGL